MLLAIRDVFNVHSHIVELLRSLSWCEISWGELLSRMLHLHTLYRRTTLMITLLILTPLQDCVRVNIMIMTVLACFLNVAG